MKDKDSLDVLYDLLTGAKDLADEHEEEIDQLLGRDGKVKLKEDDPLKELVKGEDSVEIIVETKDDFNSINVRSVDGGVEIELNDKIVMAEIPDDCVVEDVDANLNNGVLSVNIPRGD